MQWMRGYFPFLPSDTFLTECFHRAKRIHPAAKRLYRAKRIHLLSLLLLAGYALPAGCDTRRDIVDDHGVWVRVEVDWTQVEMRPEGTSIYVFSQETDERIAVLLTNEMHGGVAFDSVKLHTGNYSLLAFNNTERSHGSLSFRGTNRYHTAEAYANPVAPPAGDRYTPHATAQAAVAMAATEILAAAHIDHFEVDYEMIRRQERLLLRLVPERCTIAIAVTAHVQHMRSLHTGATPIGALTGMAEGVFLATGSANTVPATHWFALPPATFDNASNSGTLKAEFAAFHVPPATTAPHLLPLYLLLCDGSACDSEHDVTARLHDAAAESRLAIGLALELPETPCHGFDAGTNPWDDENVIEVPIMNYELKTN
jgi:hypothetical protein